MKKFAMYLTLIAVIFSTLLSASACGCNNKKSGNINSYAMELEYDDVKGEISGEMELDFVNNYENSVTELKFNLFPNAYRENAKFKAVGSAYLSKAYYNGINYGGIKINSVKSGSNNLAYSICGVDENILSVTLFQEVYPKGKASVKINFTTKLPKINHRMGITEKVVNLTGFYPILCGYDNGFYECVYYNIGDPFFSEVADYKIILTLNSGYIVASSGQIVNAKTSGNFSTLTYKISSARDFAFALSKEFEIATAKVLDVSVSYYYVKDTSPEATLKFATQSIETFTELFGKYPYSTYCAVETGFIQGGMEYPALTLISDTLAEDEFNEVVVHETAHQWWYAAVGNNEIEASFLDEGLTEYSVVLFYEKHSEYNLKREAMINSARATYKSFFDIYDMLFKKVDTTMLRPLNKFKSEYEYVNIAYMKSCIMFENLRVTIGDGKFFANLKKYFSAYAMKNAKPYDLVGVFEKSGADTNGFFDAYLNGKVII